MTHETMRMMNSKRENPLFGRASALVMRVALTISILVLAPTRADAICGSLRTDVFELAERAPAIAVVHAGADGQLVVERTLRGAASIWTRPSRPTHRAPRARRRGRVVFVPMEECQPATVFELSNQRAIVFANTNGHPFNGFGRSEVVFETTSPSDPGASEAVDAVTDWIAGDAAAHATQLLRWIARDGSRYQDDAIRHLGRAPEILSRLSAAERLAVLHAIDARSIAGLGPSATFDNAVTLARLHEPSAWDALVRIDRPAPISDVGLGSAELRMWAFNHVVDEARAAGIAAWSAWRAALVASRAGRDAMLLRGFRERGETIASVIDRHALAAAIRSGRWIDRLVATDLCEQAMGARIPWPRPSTMSEPLGTSGSAVFDAQGVEDASAWLTVAAVCEGGGSAASASVPGG
jgi:hypothetical protein